jgi:hypothetical protein
MVHRSLFHATPRRTGYLFPLWERESGVEARFRPAVRKKELCGLGLKLEELDPEVGDSRYMDYSQRTELSR